MNKTPKREGDSVGQGDMGRCIRRKCHMGIRELDASSLSILV